MDLDITCLGFDYCQWKLELPFDYMNETLFFLALCHG